MLIAPLEITAHSTDHNSQKNWKKYDNGIAQPILHRRGADYAVVMSKLVAHIEPQNSAVSDQNCKKKLFKNGIDLHFTLRQLNKNYSNNFDLID